MMPDRVSVWLDNMGLGIYREAFENNAITWDVFSELTQDDLEPLDVLLGHRKQLLRAIVGRVSSGDQGLAELILRVDPSEFFGRAILERPVRPTHLGGTPVATSH